jgi:hypothetical protein
MYFGSYGELKAEDRRGSRTGAGQLAKIFDRSRAELSLGFFQSWIGFPVATVLTEWFGNNSATSG